jgi:acyl-CoA hydrolase
MSVFISLWALQAMMSVSVLDSYVESTERIQPNQANNYENTHGGEVVRLMDELAAIAAMTVAGETCVTAHIGNVDFRNPIPVGHVAELSAYVYETGSSSLEVRVDVESRDPRDEESRSTTAACFTMVAVDEDSNPVEVPSVVPETDRGTRLVEAAPC